MKTFRQTSRRLFGEASSVDLSYLPTFVASMAMEAMTCANNMLLVNVHSQIRKALHRAIVLYEVRRGSVLSSCPTARKKLIGLIFAMMGC
jgi:hypothetical protein